jgi:S1-C subfamily serine protease
VQHGWVFLWLALVLGFGTPASAQPPYEHSVVALQVTRQLYDEYRPWMKKNAEVRRGTAVVIDGSLLLTEANMIHDANLIQVEKHGRSATIPARLVHVDAEIDLALLTVDQVGFFDDLVPVRIARSSPAEGSVDSVRWSQRQLEVSTSRVGRVEVRKTPYGTVNHALLNVTTDIAGGGWAEPVFANGKLIGLTVAQEDSVGRVVPAEVLSAYVERTSTPAARERYRGFANFGALWQVNTDRGLASYFGLEGEQRGVFIRKVNWGSTACSGLMPRDILLELDGHEIDANGNFQHERYGQLRFHHVIVEGHEPGDIVHARVLREGELVDIELELRAYPAAAALVPWRRPSEAPPYLVAGGLVFRELDGRYLLAWGDDWHKVVPAQLRYINDVMNHAQTPAQRRLIILSHVLPAPYNQGYHDLRDLPVKAINGRRIGLVSDAIEAFARPANGQHTIEFYPNATVSEIVLDAETFGPASTEILRAYEVPSPMRKRELALPELGRACESRE